MTDSQSLLVEYARTGSEAAFREVVVRFIDMVYSTALRLVDGDRHRAQDVAQVVFVDLVRAARSLPSETKLGGWLHRHTCFVAAHTMRGERRRQRREREAVEMNALQTASPDDATANFARVAPILDQAIDELGEADRTAILLRFFERQDFRSVGHAIGSNEDAARMRVTRALEKLQDLLMRKGVTTSATALSVALSAHAVQAAPAGVALTISTAALAGTVLLAPTTVATTKAIAMTTTSKTALAAVLVAAVTVAGVGVHQTQRASDLQSRLRLLERDRAAQLQRIEAERDEALQKLAALEAENVRARVDAAEVGRLRAEMLRLRQSLADAAAQRATATAAATPATPLPAVDTDLEPVQIFVANADAKVPAGQTMVFGGWATPPGKRTLFFVKPTVVDAGLPDRVASIRLDGRLIEVPEEALEKISSELQLPELNRLKVEGKATSVHRIFGSDEAASILQAFEKTAGVNLLSAPRVQTGDGRQAVISVTEDRTIDRQQYTLGPTLDLEPRIGADGASVNLTVSARLRKARE